MTPPRYSTWLLLTLGSGDDLEVIAGDLAERLPSRSIGWYRRQVAQTIVLSGLRYLTTHYVLTARAIAVGGAIMFATSWLALPLAYVVMPLILPAPISPVSWPVQALTVGGPAAISSWVVSWWHRPNGAASSLAVTLVTLLAMVGPTLTFLIRNTLEDPRFVPYLLGTLAELPLFVGILMVGTGIGILASQPAAHRVSATSR